MKNTKNIILSLILFNIAATFAGTAALLKQEQGPGFELFNKATNPITITIFTNGKFTQTADIAPQGKFLKDIDVQQPMQLGIYNTATKISTSTFSREITPQPNYFYELNAPGKTKYLTWNPAKSPSLYPQTGPLMGLMGKTESGYTLKANLAQSQIIKK